MTKKRRKQAQNIVTAVLPDVKNISTVQQKCHQRTFSAEVADSNTYHSAFDDRLDDIEAEYDGELHHPLQTGD